MNTAAITTKRAYLYMHLSILLWGLTGILGKAITLGFEQIVWYRMLISALGLFILLRYTQAFKLPPAKEIGKLYIVGCIIMIHWILFYAAIKVSNVSITLSCFSSITLFTALLEPVINKQRIQRTEIFFAIIIIAGIYLIFAFQRLYVWGIVLAVLSALFGSLFTVLNKRLLNNHSAGSITFYELTAGFLLLSACLPFYFNYTGQTLVWPDLQNMMLLLVLSLLCTVVAFTISLLALKKLSAFTLNLAVNLEPLYSIVLAILIFEEDKMLNTGFYAGTAIILFAVFLHAWQQRNYLTK
ncbi:MAG: DMT family transporter [Bacteroidia bacterium]|nr:DMT family transporter [Bacteroidia bacterium]